MSQHDYDIANQSFPSFRTDLNNALGAINSSNSGSSRPSGAVAGTIWLDTSGGATAHILKFYDGGADINLATINTTANTVDFTDSSVTFDIVNDTSPQLGGNLDVNGNSFVSTSNGNITFTPNGTGKIVFNDAAYNPEATLTDASTIAWDCQSSPVAKVTLGASRTLGAGTNAVAGQFVSLLVIQDGTGSRTLSFNAVYEFTGDTAPTLTTTAAKGDLFVFRYNGAKFLEVGRNLNLTLS